jgi:large subunit ribosomal protein L35
MPKMKTNKAAARRFKITGTGKIMRRQAGKRHLNEWMKAKAKRHLRGHTELAPEMKSAVLELFPYRKYLR